ncbi:hypothetical protein [Epilithonimonas sp.]|uniref:hypothetical protein n=1 Tax=Epilithonimonas sp. TaxID=2894511 RepID=UPI0035B491BB
MKILLFIFGVFVQLFYSQTLFNPNDIIKNSKTEQLIKSIIKTKDKKYKVEKIALGKGQCFYDIQKNGVEKYSYITHENSYSVGQFTHWANTDVKSAIKFYKNCGFSLYKSSINGNNCARMKNNSGTIFITIEKLSTKKSYIVISDGIELSDESDV